MLTVHESKFDDFGLSFEIFEKDKPLPELQTKFNKEIGEIDHIFFTYYQNIVKNYDSKYYVLTNKASSNIQDVGYARTVIDEFYWNLYEIFIENDFRELGLGTQLFEYINNESKKTKSEIRTYALPSDRQAKNFFESNSITAKLLVMERKREHNRYRP